MFQVMMNLLGSGAISTPYQEYVCIGAIILVVMLVLWTFDLVVQLFKNFWR